MADRQLEQMFWDAGYRMLQGQRKEIKVYYKYYREGFYTVITVDQTHGYAMTAQEKYQTEQWVMNQFYHPTQVLGDFPEGFPVYQVEALTLLLGGEAEQIRILCSVCRNVWGYFPQNGRVMIYENQPGEFYGLRTLLEAKPLAAGSAHFVIPYVTVSIIAVNILIFLVIEMFGSTYDSGLMLRFGAMYPPLVAEYHQWWRLFTAGFLHFGTAHLINNMLILYGIGERVEHIVGRFRMFAIYVVSLLGGSLCSYAVMLLTGQYAISAGASGAVYGVIGGFLWLLLFNSGHLEGITAKRLMFSIALMIYFGFSSEGVDNWAHIGGLLCGFSAAAILWHRKRQKD